MPEHQTTTFEQKGRIRSKVILRKGEVISLCRCWKSQKFPICDGSHKEEGNDRGPVIVETQCDENSNPE